MLKKEEVASYVNDYRIQVFDIAFLSEEQVQLFQSDFGIVADYFSQIQKNKNYVPSKAEMKHVDAVLKLMSVLTNDDRFEKVQQRDSEVRTMCEVMDRVENRGIEKGIEQGIEQGIEL